MKKLIIFIPLLALVVVVQSCSDILDNAKPSQSVEPSKALSSPGAIKGVRAGMYSQLQTPEFTTDYMLFPEAMADDIHNRIGANRLSGVSENLEFTGLMDDAGNGNGVDAYDIAYDIINRANLLINNIPDNVVSDDLKAQYRGEALFMRAFVYHHLARSLAYEPGQIPNNGDGAGFNLGVIIRTKPTLSSGDANYRPRSTVDILYQQIENDLKQAINLLGQSSSTNRSYITKAAAEAELARVYLYSQKYQMASTYAENALNDTGAQLAQPSNVASMFDETAGLNPEAIWVLTINPQTETVGLNNSLNVYTATSYLAGVPTQDVMDLYSNDDARLAWFSPCYDESAGSPKQGCLATHPAIENGSKTLEFDKWNAEAGNYADDIPYLRVSEMLLIESEARLQAGGDATTPLNKLRKARNLDPLSSVTLQDILDARRREFIGEGMRFFDLKRLGRDIRKAPDSDEQDVPYIDHRILDNIPTGQVTTSKQNAPKDSVLIQNPGYNQ